MANNKKKEDEEKKTSTMIPATHPFADYGACRRREKSSHWEVLLGMEDMEARGSRW